MCLCQVGIVVLLLLFFWVKDIYVMGYILGIICGSVGISGIGGIGGIKEVVLIRWRSVGQSVVASIDIGIGMLIGGIV